MMIILKVYQGLAFNGVTEDIRSEKEKVVSLLRRGGSEGTFINNFRKLMIVFFEH